MSDIIRLLPDSVANQIAAGEVIQRPASVVKELVENSIDAGATEVHLLITDAGRTCIQVVDNGKGMSETDARLSFERHATSKIKSATDLFDLHTMGFRGEALASIAAVAQVELKTRTSDEELGTRILISGSNIELQEPVSCSVGTNFSIKNLFFNVPARRKFLKPNQTELNNILSEFERIVLVHPDVAFTLHNNDVELFNLPAGGIRQRIVQIFGKKINQQIIPIEVETSLVKISGFVAKPEGARKKGAHQYFFVNNRFMKHAYFHHAVVDAYERLLPPGEQVSYFIYMTVDPSTIDVNIHPTKTEIKFENETPIWQILLSAIKESLGKFNEVPSIDFDTIGMPLDLQEGTAFSSNDDSPSPPFVEINHSYNPFDKAASYGNGNNTYNPKPKVEWEALYGGLERAGSKTESAVIGDDPFSPTPEQEQEEQKIDYNDNLFNDKSFKQYQYKGKYLLTSVKSGLMLIDQRRAHVRILYDRYMKQMSQSKSVTQKVLFPEVIEFSSSESVFVESVMENLVSLGFDLTNLGGRSYSINGIPEGCEGLSSVKLVHEIIDTAMQRGSVPDEVKKSIVLTMAKASAIVYGQALSEEEMVALVDELFTLESPNYTPDGKLILSVIKDNDIEKMFH